MTQDSGMISRDELEQKLKDTRDAKRGSNSRMWDRDYIENVIKIPKNGENTPGNHYFIRKYELYQIGAESHVIVRREKLSDDLIYVVCIEDYYDKLLESHTNTDHGGRDRMAY
ncbi:hypothetical protein QAD02_005391 [Eretmocerus hayati]|uniref:Uncharacterized protein n=1 Tax=Eretmocerus hayati TaxID=131215 RepID=A0ACC2NSR5_9HYME|nr:hypothetical protein QAD02_005391 [Eretmocerus hayati]